MANRLEDLEVYNLAESFGDEIWFIALMQKLEIIHIKLNSYIKSIGKQ